MNTPIRPSAVSFPARLSEALAAPVHVNVGRRGKGQIVIDFADLDDLQAIIEKLLPDGENDA